MNKEICVIKTYPGVYFPYAFFGGRMSNYVVILNYNPTEKNLMGLEYCPDMYKKKPTAACWLRLQTPLMATRVSPFGLGHFEIILKVKVSEKKYQEYVDYWLKNVKSNGNTENLSR